MKLRSLLVRMLEKTNPSQQKINRTQTYHIKNEMIHFNYSEFYIMLPITAYTLSYRSRFVFRFIPCSFMFFHSTREAFAAYNLGVLSLNSSNNSEESTCSIEAHLGWQFLLKILWDGFGSVDLAIVSHFKVYLYLFSFFWRFLWLWDVPTRHPARNINPRSRTNRSDLKGWLTCDHVCLSLIECIDWKRRHINIQASQFHKNLDSIIPRIRSW